MAKRLGRKKVKRGSEPMWENKEFPDLFVLSIPDHGGRDLAVGTKNSILDQLEDDIAAWEARFANGHDTEEEGAETDDAVE